MPIFRMGTDSQNTTIQTGFGDVNMMGYAKRLDEGKIVGIGVFENNEKANFEDFTNPGGSVMIFMCGIESVDTYIEFFTEMKQRMLDIENNKGETND